MPKLAVYGSLKTGFYNRDRFDRMFTDRIITLDTKIINGYKLYDTGFGYPAVCESNSNEPLLVELVSVSDPVFNYIDQMEYGAGYTRKAVNINGEEHFIYIMDKSLLNNCKLIKDGCWKDK